MYSYYHTESAMTNSVVPPSLYAPGIKTEPSQICLTDSPSQSRASANPPPLSSDVQRDPSLRGGSSASFASRTNVVHPYARLYAKKDEGKRRKIWNHALEKSLFNPFELSTLGAPQRRGIYIASLEAHVDRLHAQLLSLGFWPVAFDQLEPFKGLNSKTAKSMVAGLQHDSSQAKLKLLELQRANEGLERTLSEHSERQYLEGSRPLNYDYSQPR